LCVSNVQSCMYRRVCTSCETKTRWPDAEQQRANERDTSLIYD